MPETSNVRDQFINALTEHQTAFGVSLTEDSLRLLADYYKLIESHNPILHLVGPCAPQEFAVRHILESLSLLKYLPEGAKFADVGTGAGLPSIPCLLVRHDLKVVLIESKIRKADFLNEAARVLGIAGRAAIVNKQFNETTPGDSEFVACRALDKFSEKLAGLIKWAGPRTMLLFGGKSLGDVLNRLRLNVASELLPMSNQRYLFTIGPAKRQRI